MHREKKLKRKSNSPVMIVLTTKNIDMECHTRSDGEGVKDVRKHLCGKIPNLLPLKPQIGDTVWTRANVDDCTR